MIEALILDCEGVLAVCGDAHLAAANVAFEAAELDVRWDAAVAAKLAQTAGFRGQVQAWFDRYGWPGGEAGNTDLLDTLCAARDRHFIDAVRDGDVQLRDGITDLIDAASDAGLKLAVCGDESPVCVATTCSSLLGLTRSSKILATISGDDVETRKPAGDVFLAAASALDVAPGHCAVIDDKPVGCMAAIAAGMAAFCAHGGAAGSVRLPAGVSEIETLNAATIAVIAPN